ncbi:h15 domain-containing protein [Nephila pilipes]|uniref:H15 domain-containing protein n=1 Tax=Nephila pilipes TaxID=299642 RepID=A0A8X6MLQ2_NEPPI|nr:h15 domain-containing protein [Nephila pilipes]
MDQLSITQTFLKIGSNARSRILAFSVSKSESTYKKVMKAISAIENDGRGASITAIVNWILNNYAILDPHKLKLNVKKTVLKALKDNAVARSHNSRGALGITGSFTLTPKKTKLKKATKPKKRPNAIQIVMTKDDQVMKTPRLSSIKRKISAVTSANDMRSERRLSKSRPDPVIDYA